MSKRKPGPGRANGEPGAGRGAPAPAPEDAKSSNTASNSYREGCQVRVLRIGVDSLYVSFYGEMDPVVAVDLGGRKLQAQSRDPRERALAQWEVGGHIFEVSDRGQGVKGQGGFAYVLEDNAFRIALSSVGSRALPLAYAKVSSAYLAHKGPEAAVEQLAQIVATLGTGETEPTVSRVDLYADFQTDAEMEGWPRHAWITRAGSINTYSVKGEFSGYTIGQGGPISCRLYNKSLEIQKSHKAFFVDLWKRAGMEPERPVWRLEFQVDREVLYQLGIRSFAGLLRDLGGIWAYASQTWLRLSVPQSGDTNRARWPTHPLWAHLANTPWSLADSVLTRTFTQARVPALDRLYKLYLGLVTSFMAVERIQAFGAGQAAFLGRALAFNQSRCTERLHIDFEDYVAQEVAIKARLYNTLRNRPLAERVDDASDKVDRDAIDYFRATRGE